MVNVFGLQRSMQRPQKVLIRISAALDLNGGGGTDIGATAAAHAACGVVLDQTAIRLAGAFMMMRQAKGDRAAAKILKDKPENIHERYLM
jgi:hypothetical protein